MRTDLLFAAFAALALASCNEMPYSAPVAEGMVELNVEVPVASTRVTGTPAAEDAVANLQVFVFDQSSGVLEAYGNQNNTKSLKLTCLPGDKDIVALVNAPSCASVATLAALQAKTSSLSDNAAGSLVMSGSVRKTLSSTDKSVTIDVSRIAAKVTLLSVKNAMELKANQDKEFVVTGVYLINVTGSRKYLSDSTPGTWYHKMRYESSNTLSFLYDTPKSTVKWNETYSNQHHFYCYPNTTSTDANAGTWTPRKTRLVVEATLGGEKCYYPVTLAEISQNTAYNVTLTVTRPGSMSPDIPISTEEATFTVNVKDWIDGTDYTETI
ncbi:MAG: hypothetical protein IKU36_09290 [Bacteroidales bacterium]|nr:hypothetical protein [Bacteroidales bacterium]